MENVEIFEQELLKGNRIVGKVAILRGGFRTGNPTELMNNAVSTYVGTTSYNEFIEISLDNPWIRVIVNDINELDYQPFDIQRL